MTNEERKRDLERRQACGDVDAGEQLEHLKQRIGESRADLVRRFVGRLCYIEGARMNYVGILERVTTDQALAPAELWFSKLWRIGEWNRNGVVDQYTQKMVTEDGLPQCVPFSAVDNFGLSHLEIED